MIGRLFVVALVAGPLSAQTAPPPADPVPAHDTFTVVSRTLGEARLINVHTPPEYHASAATRLPVLYMPDGGLDEDFPHVVNTIDSLIALRAIRPVIVVGVPNTQRRRDLTGPTRIASDSAIAPRVGGSAAFRRFLRDELIPAVEARYRTTAERAIVGESLAGLFVVETFLVEPRLFDHYVALDPSVWWNRGALVDSAPARLAALDSAPRTLYLATSNVADIAGGTARLAALLRTVPPRKLAWVYVPRPDLTHATIFRAVAPAALASALQTPPSAASQNPSPMIEATRTHERLAPTELGGAGTVRSLVGPAGKPVDIWVPDHARRSDVVDVVIHFHGAAWLPEQAVAALGNATVAVVVNLGVGSGAYDRAFADPTAFDSLLVGVSREVAAAIAKPVRLGRVTLVGFSAGHGAVRAIIRESRHFARVSAILLLDGMHTSYVPDGTVLAAGGALDTTNLAAFANFARAAVRGEKRFVVTHSEIFPGTFASTTETADWLLHALGLRRTPVLRWGPRGMQQLSEVRAGRFELLGFAGNSAPDHVDHLHAMPELLARALER